jgi:pyruvate kinase
MARYVSNMRPEKAPIFAFTLSEHVYRQLALCWGTYPILMDFTDDPNRTIESAVKYLRDEELTEPNDSLVILSDIRAGEALVDCVQLRTVK